MTDKWHGVSFANPDDAPEVYKMMLDLHDENGLFTVNPEKAAWMCSQCFDPKIGVVGVIRGEGIEGAIAMKRAQLDYTDDWHLAEQFNYVRPAYRKSDHAKRLILFAKAVEQYLGLPVLIGIVSTRRTEAKMRLYRRMLTQVGGFFMCGTTPRLAPDVEAAAERDGEEDRLLSDYREAVGRLFRSETFTSGRDRRTSRDDAMKKLRSVHERASKSNGHAERLVM